MCKRNHKHSANRLCSTPEKLIANGESCQVLWSQVHLAQAPNRYIESSCSCGRRKMRKRVSLVVRHKLHPIVVFNNCFFDLLHWYILFQLHGNCLRMATHRTHADALIINRYLLGGAKELVAFSTPFPFLLCLSGGHRDVDPWNQRSCKWDTKIISRMRFGAKLCRD